MRNCGSGDLKNNYFLMPNDVFVLDLTPSEFKVYAYLRKCVDNITYQCWPSYQTIARETKLSKSTVKRCADRLAELRLVDTERTCRFTKSGEKVNGNLRYTLLPLREAKAAFYEHQMAELEQAAERQSVRKLAAKKAAKWEEITTPDQGR